jgi:hypothetical protein
VASSTHYDFIVLGSPPESIVTRIQTAYQGRRLVHEFGVYAFMPGGSVPSGETPTPGVEGPTLIIESRHNKCRICRWSYIELIALAGCGGSSWRKRRFAIDGKSCPGRRSGARHSWKHLDCRDSGTRGWVNGNGSWRVRLGTFPGGHRKSGPTARKG